MTLTRFTWYHSKPLTSYRTADSSTGKQPVHHDPKTPSQLLLTRLLAGFRDIRSQAVHYGHDGRSLVLGSPGAFPPEQVGTYVHNFLSWLLGGDETYRLSFVSLLFPLLSCFMC